MKNEIEKILAEYSDGKETLQEATTKVLRLFSVSGQLPTPQDIQWKARQLTNTAFNEWWEKQVGNLR
jgi:hypothetical protein